MRLVMFDDGKGARLGAMREGAIADLASVCAFQDVLSVCDAGLGAVSELARLAGTAPSVKLGAARLHAPIPRPRRNISGVGKNYPAHAKESHASAFDPTATSAVPPFANTEFG